MTDEPFDPGYLVPEPDASIDEDTGMPYDVDTPLIPPASADVDGAADDPQEPVPGVLGAASADTDSPPQPDFESPFAERVDAALGEAPAGAGLWGDDDGLQEWLDQTPAAPESPDPAADLLFTGRLQEIVADDVSGVDRDRLVEDAVRRSLQTDG